MKHSKVETSGDLLRAIGLSLPVDVLPDLVGVQVTAEDNHRLIADIRIAKNTPVYLIRYKLMDGAWFRVQ